ncbi:glycosyltransferase [Luteolibacter sp. SL250]|uniref:glycosyltransferase family 2 protein n=1 Tax=Luteolibacter sp. SL250 TaxID=2995170 RepID=UPI00226E9248|nr:glycosyltransferase [Luteolibacter sp. SL250]WAC19252.1 glycosyltransferase [Luteolibacter sp. SL250]
MLVTLSIIMCCGLYLLLLGMKGVLAVLQARKDAHAEEPFVKLRTLTVLQPILSGDEKLERMLESNLLSLPGQCFIWLCDSEDAEAIRVAEKLRAAHPGHQIAIVICPDCPDGVNPKVFKLIQASPMVETPYFAVLDDDTHLPTATAADLVMHAQGAMVSTALPSYRESGGFSGTLLAQFVNNNSAMTYLSLLPFCPPISLNGMCYVMKTGDIGIFMGITRHLTDDLALAGAVKAAGGVIHQSSLPVFLTTHVDGFPHYLRMMHRWYLFALLLVRGQSPARQVVIFAMYGWHQLLLWVPLVFLVIRPSLRLAVFTVIVFIVRSFILQLMQAGVFGMPIHRPFASLISELLQPLHMIHALVNRRIRWRSRRYRVFASDRFHKDE